uniref:Uncharacterized protein n=1 Tax=Musa acuminata subsp. malaccensis TaxID=214687 RepID=A0A804L7C4_MUSAM|nr:PREDICTED: uncharacterized protein LOC103971385 isoform X2 [Musa acuminata subsp. malaccensis]
MKRSCLLTPTSGLGEGMSAGKRPAWARGSPHDPSIKASGGPPRAKPNPLVKIPLSLASSARDLDPAVVRDRDPVVRAFLRPLSDLAPEPPEEIVARPAPSSFLVVDVATFGIMAPSLALAGLVYRCSTEGLADLCFRHEVLSSTPYGTQGC